MESFHLPFFFDTRLCVVLIGTAKRNTVDDRKTTQLRHFSKQREPSQQLWPVRDGVLLQRRSPEVNVDHPRCLRLVFSNSNFPRIQIMADDKYLPGGPSHRLVKEVRSAYGATAFDQKAIRGV